MMNDTNDSHQASHPAEDESSVRWSLRSRVIALALIAVAAVGLVVCRSSPPSEATGTTVRFDGFAYDDLPSGTEWDPLRIDYTPFGRRYMGPFEDETVSFTVNDLPEHESVQIAFDLFVIKSWDGNDERNGPDRFRVVAEENDEVFDASFSSGDPDDVTRQSYPLEFGKGDCRAQTGVSELDTLGFLFRDDRRDSIYRVIRTFTHSEESLHLRFVGTGLGPSIEDEGWGLDNFALTTFSDEQPQPELPLPEGCEAAAT